MSRLDATCSFCGKTERAARAMLTTPEARLCLECLALCNEIIPAAGSAKKPPAPQSAGLRCTFCGETGADGRHMIAGPRVYVCEQCVRVGNELVANG